VSFFNMTMIFTTQRPLDSRENWRDWLGIVTTSAVQSRLSSKWFSFVWITEGIAWRN